MVEPTDFKSTEYKKVRIDARVPGWHILPMDLTREGWSREDDVENLRFVGWRMAPGPALPADPVFILTFRRPKKKED